MHRRPPALADDGREVIDVGVAVHRDARRGLSRQPSTIEAWFSSSEQTRVPGPPSVVRTPRFAAKPVGKSTAALGLLPRRQLDLERRGARAASPTISRAAPEPAPQRSSAAWAAAITVGCWVSPR